MENVTVTTKNIHQPHTNCHCADTINDLNCEIHYLTGQVDTYERILDQLVGNG